MILLLLALLTARADEPDDALARTADVAVLADAGRPRAALRALPPLPPEATPLARDVDALWRAELAVALGRKGAVDTAHATLELLGGPLPALEARVRLAIVHARVDEADRTRLRGKGAALRRAVTRRTTALAAAEAEGPPLIATHVPGPALAGLLAIADGFERYADALLAAPVPRRLTADQRAVYVETLARRVRPILLDARAMLDLGVTAADELGLAGPDADALRDGLARVTARVEVP